MATQTGLDDAVHTQAETGAERSAGTATMDESGPSRAMRSIGYPSNRFPGPPAVGLSIPEAWLPVNPAAYIRFGPKIDLAVVGPSVVDGVRPSLIVSTTRTDPTDDPRQVLAQLVAAGGDEERVGRGSFGNQGDHVCHAVGYEDVDDGRSVRRLQCMIYHHHPMIAHVVTVIGSVAASDLGGLDDLSAALSTLRLSLIWPPASATGSGDHG